jgi:hypothetical protein
MADSHLPLDDDRGEVILDDFGGWISGSCIAYDSIPAAEVRAGDLLLLDDGLIAEVDDVVAGDFWVATATHAPALAIGWNEVDGTARGQLFRTTDQTLHRVRDGAR